MAAVQTKHPEPFMASSGVMTETKPTIPVVTHVITDEDIGALQVKMLIYILFI